MHRYKGNAIPTGSYVGYFSPYITIGYRENAEIYSGKFQKLHFKIRYYVMPPPGGA